MALPNLAFADSEEVKPKPSAAEQLKVVGSYEYNFAGKRLTRSIDPVLLKRLSEHPEEDSEFDNILSVWILKAGVEKREEFKYLLEIEALRKIPRIQFALLAYDYNINGNQKSLAKLLESLQVEVVNKEGWGAGSWAGLPSFNGLEGVNEWKLTKQILGSVKLSTDGSAGDERYGFWLTRRYFFPNDKEFPANYDNFCKEMDKLQSKSAK